MGRLLTIAALVAAIAAPAAAAHLVPKHKAGARHAEAATSPAKAKLRWHLKNLKHADSTLRWFERHSSTHLYGGPLVRRAVAWRVVEAHRWLKRHALGEVREIRAAQLPPHYSMWQCIHRQEGSWTDPNAPYFGGLQMGYWFMRTYGWSLYASKGTADRWTKMEQLWVAERAYRRSGYSRAWLFGQWPNTGPPCA